MGLPILHPAMATAFDIQKNQSHKHSSLFWVRTTSRKVYRPTDASGHQVEGLRDFSRPMAGDGVFMKASKVTPEWMR